MTRFIWVGVVAALYPLIVVTSMHVGISPVMVQSFADNGYENFFCSAGSLVNADQGFACEAVVVKPEIQKSK